MENHRISKPLYIGHLLVLILSMSNCLAQKNAPNTTDVSVAGLEKIKHIIVIYQENRSFDHLLGNLPGVNGISNATDEQKTQIDENGNAYATLPIVMLPFDIVDQRFPSDLANKPFSMLPYAPMDSPTGVPAHKFYNNQDQINGGKMNKFALLAGHQPDGLPMGNYNANKLSLGRLATEFTVCDNFHQAAFGGSFLNHQWLIAARTPFWPEAPARIRSIEKDGKIIKEGEATPDGYIVNTIQPEGAPHANPNPVPSWLQQACPNCKLPNEVLLPSLSYDTIGDRLTEKEVSWAWYAQSWDLAMMFFDKNNTDLPGFSYHHQPFVYFDNYLVGKPGRTHLQDLTQFFTGLREDKLPSVSYIKLTSPFSEHPGQNGLEPGVAKVGEIIAAIRASKSWQDTAIILTYDENGGFWDHVPPPVNDPPRTDRWGPSNRVPTVIISPFAKKGFVDTTYYDTTSILKFIETRFKLKPLNTRDAAANNMLNAFDFNQ